MAPKRHCAPVNFPAVNTLLASAALLLLGGQPAPPSIAPDFGLRAERSLPASDAHTGPVFDGRRGQLKVVTPRQDAAAVVDGKLDEPEWNRAALLTGFSQFFPSDGVAAEEIGRASCRERVLQVV